MKRGRHELSTAFLLLASALAVAFFFVWQSSGRSFPPGTTDHDRREVAPPATTPPTPSSDPIQTASSYEQMNQIRTFDSPAALSAEKFRQMIVDGDIFVVRNMDRDWGRDSGNVLLKKNASRHQLSDLGAKKKKYRCSAPSPTFVCRDWSPWGY